MPLSAIKTCRSNRAFQNEIFVYESSFPHRAALLEARRPLTLVLSKLKGIPYLDADEFTNEQVELLARVIVAFHSTVAHESKVLCHWDNQPRNILWNKSKRRFWLLDFEAIRIAPPEADISHLFLFWAEVFDHIRFESAVLTFIGTYKQSRKLDSTRWRMEARKARNRFDQRRKKYNKLERLENTDRSRNRKYLLHLRLDDIQ